IDAWAAMRAKLFPREDPAKRRREIAAILASDTQAGFGVRAGDAWLAFMEVQERSYGQGCDTSPVGYVEALWVEPETRRQGVARQLVAAAIDWCRGRGLSELASDAQIDNLVSQAMHRALGFEETQRLVTFRMKLPPQRR